MKIEPLLNLGRKIIPNWLFRMGQPFYHFYMALSGNIRFGFPGRKLIVIGVTGTNGKSTTVELVNSVLKANGIKTGMLSTVAFEIAGKRTDNTTNRTTLGRWQTQRKLHEMVEAGCTHAVLEVASEGIKMFRIWGIPFDVAVFTNLAPEHLNTHKTMENYRNTKGRLFANLAKAKKKGVPKTLNLFDRFDPLYYLLFI
jgi:UDP-N-acetylmuramyl tripeptide synthase